MPPLHRRHALALLGTLPWLAASPAAQAQRKLGSASFSERIRLGGQTLALNGAGIRYKAMFQVYAAALYLEQPATTLEAVLQLKGCKRLTATMLREVNATELGNLFTKGIVDNIPPQETQTHLTNISRMGGVFSRFKSLKEGDSFTADRLPGKGMVLIVNNEAQHEPFDEAFFDAILNIWLGPKPADRLLKQALLGGSPDLNRPANNG